MSAIAQVTSSAEVQNTSSTSVAAAAATSVAAVASASVAAASKIFSGLGIDQAQLKNTFLNFDNILSDRESQKTKPPPQDTDLIDWSLECATDEEGDGEVEFLGATPGSKVGRAPRSRKESSHSLDRQSENSETSKSSNLSKFKEDCLDILQKEKERATHRSRQVSRAARSSIPSRVKSSSRSGSVKRTQNFSPKSEDGKKVKKMCETGCDDSLVIDKCSVHKEQPPVGPGPLKKILQKPKPLPTPPMKSQQKLRATSSSSSTPKKSSKPNTQKNDDQQKPQTPGAKQTKSGDKLKKRTKSGDPEKILASSRDVMPLSNRFDVLAKDSSPSPSREKNLNPGA